MKGNKMTKEVYKIKAYVPVHGGYFTYEVSSKEQACHHAAAIMHQGVYRRINDAGEFEFWPVYKVKVCGPGLDTEYPDTFVRT